MYFDVRIPGLPGTSGVTLRKRHRCSACPVLFANFGRAPAKTSHAMFKASAQQQAMVRITVTSRVECWDCNLFCNLCWS